MVVCVCLGSFVPVDDVVDVRWSWKWICVKDYSGKRLQFCSSSRIAVTSSKLNKTSSRESAVLNSCISISVIALSPVSLLVCVILIDVFGPPVVILSTKRNQLSLTSVPVG